MRAGRILFLIGVVVALAGCRGKLDLAAIQLAREKWESAAKLYGEYLEEDPKSAIALRSLSAIECNRLGDYERCAEHADRLLAMMPRDSQAVATGAYAYTLLAERAAEARDTTRAHTYLNRIADIYYVAAYWNYMNENYRIAEEQFRNVIRLRPGDPLAYLRLGILYWNRHMEDSSIAWFERAVQANPLDSLSEDALINLIVLCRETGQHERALEEYHRLTHLRAVLYPDSVFQAEIDTTRQPLLDYRHEASGEHGPHASF